MPRGAPKFWHLMWDGPGGYCYRFSTGFHNLREEPEACAEELHKRLKRLMRQEPRLRVGTLTRNGDTALIELYA